MIVDGKQIAAELAASLKSEFGRLEKKARLGVLRMNADFAAEKFVSIKRKTAERVGVELIERTVPEGVSTEDVIRALAACAAASDGVIVQLPLASHVDADKVIAAIPADKDADGIAPGSSVLSPVVLAMREVLERAHVHVGGKNIVIIGQGKLVGLPATRFLREEGASVTVVTVEGGDVGRVLPAADIVVLGAGCPGLVKPHMLKKGAVVLDMGTSEAGGKLAGDADPSCAKVASVFTPVPGGIGPIAVVMIFKNLLGLIRG